VIDWLTRIIAFLTRLVKFWRDFARLINNVNMVYLTNLVKFNDI